MKTPNTGCSQMSTSSDSHMMSFSPSGFDDFALNFGEACGGILGGLGDMVNSDPNLMDGIMNLDHADFGFVGHDAMQFMSMSPALPKMCTDALLSQHYTGSSFSPLLAGKMQSPRGAFATSRMRRTGFTPQRSPRMAQFQSPYHLRSGTSPASGYTPKMGDFALPTDYLFGGPRPVSCREVEKIEERPAERLMESFSQRLTM